MNVIYRYEVPVDDAWHEICTGRVLHVGCRNPFIVEFWAHPPSGGQGDRKYRVYGTGHELDPESEYVDTAIAPGGGLVWHLMSKW